MSVPSNLIPTTITQLPEAPVASPSGYFPIVIAGTTYKVQFSQISANVTVPPSRRVNAGTGLTGGGSLSADITIAVENGGITDTQLDTTGVTAGSYGSGSQVPVLTVSAAGRITGISVESLIVTGYVPDTRFINTGNGLTGGGNLSADRTLSVDYATSAPQSVGSATVGTATGVSRGDHVHPAINLTNTTQTSGILPPGRGGTGNAIVPTPGTLIYSNGTYLDQTDQGFSGAVLQANGTAAPTWVSPSTLVVARAANISGGAANRIVYQTAPNTTGFLTAPTVTDTFLKWNGTAFVWAASSAGGTVTSVDGSGGTTGLTVSGGPITSAGTLTLGGTLAISAGGTGLSGTPTNGQLLIGNGSGYTQSALTAGSGISIANATGSISIANTAPDQTVTISSGTNATVTGTYPSFTVSATGDVVGPAGSTNNAIALFDDGTGKLLKNSPVTISSTGVISGVASPEANTDAANKLYVDGLVSTGLTFHDPVQLATTSAFTSYNITYANGTAGVSATITQAVPYASLTIDSTAAAVNNRILVKDAANAAYNGIYYVTSTGSGATPWVLTRTSDADTYGPNVNQLSRNDYFFTQNGVANKGAAFVCTTSGTITFGTTGITFTEFSVSQVYTVGNGLSLTGTTISLETPVTVLNGGTGLSSAASNGQLPIGNGAGFTLSALTAGTGIGVTNATGSISIANTAPDQTVTLTGSTAISVSGTYPSFTLTNTAPDQTVTLTGSTAISVSGTYPSFTLTNTAPNQTVTISAGTAITVGGGYPSYSITNSSPDQTVTLTGSGGTSISGTYPSFTISSSSSGGTVTSVAVSGGSTGLTTSGGPVTSSGTITLAGTLAITAGGTGASSQSGARTALGLGTMATQDASSVVITGGSIGSSVLVNLGNATGTISGGTY